MKQQMSILVAGIIGLVIGEVRAEPAKSVQTGDEVVSLSVRNDTRLALLAGWVNFEGRLKLFGKIAPGQTKVYETHPGHLWRFGAENQVLGEYRATDEGEQLFVVGGLRGAGAGVPPRGEPLGPDEPDGEDSKPAMVPETDKQGQSAERQESGDQSPAAAGSGSQITAEEQSQLLDFHNKARREVGVEAVAWSPEIAGFAQQWADELAREGKFEHRPQDQQRYGENLAAGASVLAGANLWYGEKSEYRAGTAFDMNMMSAGHYTQMVWRGTTRIGAGKAVICSGPYKGLTVLVCNYNPRGNMIGQKPY